MCKVRKVILSLFYFYGFIYKSGNFKNFFKLIKYYSFLNNYNAYYKYYLPSLFQGTRRGYWHVSTKITKIPEYANKAIKIK